MNRNVGTVDRIARALLGGAAVVASLMTGLTSGLGLLLVFIAAVLLGTAVVGFCPLYRLFGVTTADPGQRAVKPVTR